MWLLHAHVNVNGQSHFTFPLERSKSYAVGRRAEKDILFLSKRVRLDEGRLHVGDWDPSNPGRPPAVLWYPAPKKGKDALIPKYTVIRSRSETVPDELDSYDATEVNETQVDLVEHRGMGIRFDVDADGSELPGWFALEWINVCILYDELKNEPETKKEVMTRYCIAYQMAFDPEQLPTVTLANVFRPALTSSFSVCYGIPIAKVLYLDLLLGKLENSWKKAIDSEDSFTLPDAAALIPDEFDPKLPQTRRTIAAWEPRPERRTLFKGWSVLSINNASLAAEKKWMIAMGIHWYDIDLAKIPHTPQAIEEAAKGWIKVVDDKFGRDRAFMCYFTTTKQSVKDFDTVMGTVASTLGVKLVNGKVCWLSVSLNSVEQSVELVAKSELANNPSAIVQESTAGSPRSRSPQKTDTTRKVSPAKSAQKPDEVFKVPSTFPDEPAGTARAIEAEPSAPPATSRRPLKRRAGKTAIDLFAMDDDTPSSADVSPHESQDKDSGSMSMPPAAQPEDPATQIATQATQMPSSTATRVSRLKRRAGATASVFDMFDSAPAESSAFPDSASGYESIQVDSEMPAGIRELYEQTKKSSKLPPSRQTRAASRDSAGDVEMSDAPALASRRSTRAGSSRRSVPPDASEDGNVLTPAPRSALGDVIEVEDEDEDFIQRTLKNAAAAKRAGRTQALKATNSQLAMPPPKIPAVRRRSGSPDEESERIEPKKARTNESLSQSKTNKVARAIDKAAQMDVDEDEESEPLEPSNTPTQDTAFLQAISKSRSKKAIDEMDKEFNNLRIPKPATKGGARGKGGAAADQAQGPAGQEKGKWDGPDYSVLNDFTDEMRGNFIQVVKMDLFRKDGGRKEGLRDDAGRPNFKKFKKKEIVRRDPVPLVLVGLNTEEAELGEPYWPGPTGAPSRKSQSTQSQFRGSNTQGLDGGDEDTLPLLPVQRRTQMAPAILEDDEDDEDGLGPTPLASTARRCGAASQFGANAASQASTAIPKAPARRTRGTSVMSEDSTMSGPAPGGTSRSRATASKTGATSRSTGGTKRQPMLLEDSDEDEGVRFTPSVAGSSRAKSTSTGNARGSTAPTSTAAARGRRVATGSTTQSRLFDDDDDMDPPLSAITATRRTGMSGRNGLQPDGSMSASAMGSSMANGNASSRTARAKQTAATGTSAGQVRKMLVDDDDDDDVVITTAAKKRRLG